MTNLLGRDVREIILRLCEDASTPRAVTVAILVRYEEWGQLVSLSVDPMQYVDSDSYRRDAVVTSLLRKCADLPTGIDTASVAVKNFWLSEHQCYRSNERLSPYLFGGGDERIASIIASVRKEVARILGPVPRLLTKARHGPGATFEDKGRLTTVPDKMSSTPTFTPLSLPHIFEWSGTSWARACDERGRTPKRVRGNRFTTVPKDATKDRGIAIEPSINVYFQLGVGAHIRERLLLDGIDLRNGQDIHRQVACEASKDGHLATIDLSNASDTVSYNLVKLLLPAKWFHLLDSLRSPFTLINGKWVKLEKFSSMGNGFTFELETLLFLAISLVAVRQKTIPVRGSVLVYGDDIIVPSTSAKNVIEFLKFLGFTPNEKKTFSEGWFRESCGGDYFRGAAVRPHFLKELPNEPQDFIRFANGLRRVGMGHGDDLHRYDFTFRAWLRVLDAIPSPIRRLRGPQDLGDIVIHDDRTDLWSAKRRNSIRYIRCYKPVPARRVGWGHWHPSVVLATALYGLGDGSRGPLNHRDGGGVTPRGAVSGYRVGWAVYS